MDVSFVAKLKTYDDFIACYNEGDEKKLYDGESLLFYSISNNNVGTEVNGINEYGENLLHILLSRVNHNIEQTTEMCRRLIDKGVDEINTGNFGDGKIFVYDVEDAVRIRTGEHGDKAL